MWLLRIPIALSRNCPTHTIAIFSARRYTLMGLSELAITDRGSVMIDDEVIGTIDPGNLSVDVIGRQAIMSHGGYARFLRVGYPGKGFIPFSNDEIVMENDY